MTPNGLGEMAVEDTRSFSGGRFHVSAVPFQTGSDVGVDDHRKYLAVSTRAFPVPSDGTLVLSADVKASTPGTVPGLTQLGAYGPSGSWRDPAKPPPGPEYTARRLQGQQAGVVMNVLDFCTGQVFDWFIASDAAFALIERLPTVVTGMPGTRIAAPPPRSVSARCTRRSSGRSRCPLSSGTTLTSRSVAAMERLGSTTSLIIN